jgi:hypothetical protein
MKTMYHLLMNLPVVGTLGVAALLVGPLARAPIDLGAWLLEHLDRRLSAASWITQRLMRQCGVTPVNQCGEWRSRLTTEVAVGRTVTAQMSLLSWILARPGTVRAGVTNPKPARRS